jgi:hypothetical protein
MMKQIIQEYVNLKTNYDAGIPSPNQLHQQAKTICHFVIDLTFPSDIHESICNFYRDLEIKLGKKLVSTSNPKTTSLKENHARGS